MVIGNYFNYRVCSYLSFPYVLEKNVIKIVSQQFDHVSKALVAGFPKNHSWIPTAITGTGFVPHNLQDGCQENDRGRQLGWA